MHDLASATLEVILKAAVETMVVISLFSIWFI